MICSTCLKNWLFQEEGLLRREIVNFQTIFKIISMGILKKIEGLVKKIDFFYSTEMLRYDEDEDYKTFTGGVISLGIVTAILIGFASMILSTLDQTSISTSTQVIKNQVPSNSTLNITPESDFRFGVQIWRVNLSDTKRYFDVTFENLRQNNGQIYDRVTVPFEACTKQYFAGYPEVLTGFDKLGAGGWLCPPLNTTMNLYGKYSSEWYSQYVITVGACHNQTDPSKPCASPEEIQAFFIENGDFLYFTLYFINPQINSDEKEYKKYYLEDMSYVIFGRTMGSESFLYFTDYTINTDYSIWPYQHIVEDKGCIVEDLAVNHPFQTNINSTYVTLSLVKSPNSIVYTRQVQKLSSVFSFMGGMIGAISAVLFIIKIYTNVAFEFSISSELFKDTPPTREHQENKLKEKLNSEVKEKDEGRADSSISQHISINFFNFIKYYIYLFTKKIGKPCDWPVMHYADKCKDQISKQLDVKVLLKRIIFLEHCLTFLVEDYHLSALQMKKPFSPQEIKLLRQKCERIENKESRSSNSDPGSQHTFKQQCQSPNNCISLNSPTPVMRSRFGRPSNKVAPEIEVVDIQDSISSKREIPQMSGIDRIPSFMKISHQKKNRNSHRRSSYLQDLHKSAMEGNVLSAKIWNQLDERTKKQIQEAEGSENEHLQ